MPILDRVPAVLRRAVDQVVAAGAALADDVAHQPVLVGADRVRAPPPLAARHLRRRRSRRQQHRAARAQRQQSAMPAAPAERAAAAAAVAAAPAVMRSSTASGKQHDAGRRSRAA